MIKECQDFTPDAAGAECQSCGAAVAEHVPSVMRIARDTNACTPEAVHAAEPVARLPHGYESDAAALRAVVTLYSEAAIDARPAFSTAADGDFPHDCRDERPPAGVALNRLSDLNTARDELRDVWSAAVVYGDHPTLADVRRCLAHLGDGYTGRRAAWLVTVGADVLSRLGGDAGRPLPASPAAERAASDAASDSPLPETERGRGVAGAVRKSTAPPPPVTVETARDTDHSGRAHGAPTDTASMDAELQADLDHGRH